MLSHQRIMKTILITGGTAGLGLEAALQLSALGHDIIITGRDVDKCEKAKKQIEAAGTGNNVDFFVADLSSQKQIRKMSGEIHARAKKIDVLINNAGGVFHSFILTDEGIEKTFALNHMGYFLVTDFLLNLIPAGGRIINVSSDSHFSAVPDFESITKNNNHTFLKAYAWSKLANVLFTYELARRLASKNITVNAISPGRVKTLIGTKNQPWYVALGWKFLTAFSSVSPAESVKTFVYLATDEQVSGITGKYFFKSEEKRSSPLSYNKELSNRLWNHTESLVKYPFTKK